MKKKIMALALCVALAAIAVVGATLAYFTDTAEEKNTFTVGNVKIKLIEQQKGAEGLEPFEQNKLLMPGKTDDGNAVSKIVTVKNTGKNDAWVWVDILVPEYLLNGTNPQDQSTNALHYQEYGAFSERYWNVEKYKLKAENSAVTDGVFKVEDDGSIVPTDSDMVGCNENTVWTEWTNVGTEKIGDTTYVILRTKMVGKLPAGKITLPCLSKVYMDWRVTTGEVGGKTVYNLPNGKQIYTDASWEILVKAYAIQADGINDVNAAIAAYTNNGK